MPTALSWRCSPVRSRALDSASSSNRKRDLPLVVALPAAPFAVVEVVVTIPQQAGQIVGRGADQGVLKVDDAEASVRPHQEIAAVVVAMNQALGLAEGIVDQRLERFGGGLPAVARRAGRPGTTRRRCPVRRGSGIPGRAGCRAHRCAAGATRLSMATARAESCSRGAVDIFKVPASQVAEQKKSRCPVFNATIDGTGSPRARRGVSARRRTHRCAPGPAVSP